MPDNPARTVYNLVGRPMKLNDPEIIGVVIVAAAIAIAIAIGVIVFDLGLADIFGMLLL